MKIIAYYRVSTVKQGASGLGLEAQETAVKSFALANQGQILKSYCEVESGKKADRPQLTSALAHARRAKAVLVIAKLDRLARNVAFVSALMESGADFVCVDNPTANKLTIHILAAVAEDEARRISERTKAALAAYKARGGVLGSAREECKGNLSAEAQIKGRRLAAVARTAKAKAAYTDLLPMVKELKDQGKSLRAIADALNAQGYKTRREFPWNPVQVGRILAAA